MRGRKSASAEGCSAVVVGACGDPLNPYRKPLGSNLAPLAQEKRRPRRGEVKSSVRRLRYTHRYSLSHRGLDTPIYPRTLVCSRCYLILHGIGCSVTGPLSLGALHRASRFSCC